MLPQQMMQSPPYLTLNILSKIPELDVIVLQAYVTTTEEIFQ